MKQLIIIFTVLTTINASAQSSIKSISRRVVAAAGDKKIVALGEDTHGTHEYYQIRIAVSKRLIRKKGFTTFMLENPHEDMLQLQRDLYTVNLDTLMRRHLFPIYQTSEMKKFLQWFKRYSRRRPQLRLTGCDDSYREILPKIMIEEAEKLNAPELLEMCKEFQVRQSHDEDDIEYGVVTYELLSRIDSVYKAQPIRSSFMEELIMHARSAYIFYYKYSHHENVSRDEIMGERICYHAAQPGAKVIVWAHDGHIARYAWLSNELGRMGETIAKHFGNDYLSVGMSTGGGTYSYINNRFINGDHIYDDTLFTAQSRDPKDSSWNKEAIALYSRPTLFSASQLPAAEILFRIQGYRHESGEYKEYYPVNLSRMFDLLVFIPATTATEGLFR